jgi:ATP-dependent Clp protease ATP-binding subunit ClpA
MLSKCFTEVLELVPYMAERYKHKYSTLEHLLMVLLSNESVVELLRANLIDAQLLQSQIDHHLSTDPSHVVSDTGEDPRPTMALQRVIQRAAVYGNAKGHDNITTLHLLTDMFL